MNHLNEEIEPFLRCIDILYRKYNQTDSNAKKLPFSKYLQK